VEAVDASLRHDALRHTNAVRVSQRVFFGVVVLVFALCVGLTVVRCMSMSTMPELPMPGGWSLSMTWAPMCGQKWPRLAVSFVGMWIVMMVAMMLPSLAPVLWRYHEALGKTGEMRAHRLTALLGIGYVFAWAVFGVIVFAFGFALMVLAMRSSALSHALPAASGVVVLLAGVAQLSSWKARDLACSRVASLHVARSACLQGLRLGLNCIACCAGLTAVLLVNGVMDLRAMALVTLAVSAERLAPAPERVAQVIGVVVIVLGLSMLARVVGFV
jgi:predicted metal-binding membrane protein